MKVLLTAINSKSVHSNLAVRYLKAFTEDMDYECQIREFSINDRDEKILEEIIKEKADVVAFSTYIWNIEIVKRLSNLIKLVDENIKIVYGGPEVSYDSLNILKEMYDIKEITPFDMFPHTYHVECVTMLKIKNENYRNGVFLKELMENRNNKITGEQEKDIHEKNAEYLENSYKNALYVAKKCGWNVIECVKDGKLRSIEDINDEIYNLVMNV